MGCVIDHLQEKHRVRVLQVFLDARGRDLGAVETGVILEMELDWPRQEIVISWERDGAREKLVFGLAATNGPRNGHMRAFFALEQAVPLPKPPKPSAARVVARQPEDLVAGPVGDSAGIAGAFARIPALAAQGQLDEAERQIRFVLDGQDPFGGRLQQLAEEMVGIAEAHASDADATVYDWARKRAVDLGMAGGPARRAAARARQGWYISPRPKNASPRASAGGRSDDRRAHPRKKLTRGGPFGHGPASQWRAAWNLTRMLSLQLAAAFNS